MKKKTLVASILGGALLLGVSGCLVVKKFDSNANPTKATKGPVSLILEDVEAGEAPDYFSILCPIKTSKFSYEQYKDKDLVLSYDVNSQFEGKNLMKMKVSEYEEDGVTPKTVYFESEVVGRVKAWITYRIYAIDKDATAFDVPYAGAPSFSSQLVARDIYECGFEEEENASPYNSVVALKSSDLDVNNAVDELYAKITYSINGGEEKTVFAPKDYKVLPNSAIYESYSYEALVFANKGDVIDYTVTTPIKDNNETYEETHQVVVK